jgi:UDP-N-acetylenolpyruvoylglucosamine reductase
MTMITDKVEREYGVRFEAEIQIVGEDR